jgi:uncharacterized coiled-coil protein SlyX
MDGVSDGKHAGQDAAIVRGGPPPDTELDGLRARVAELEGTLTERDAELTRLQTELAAFRIHYRQHVGRLHEQVDELERAIDEAERAVTGPAPEEAPEEASAPAEPAEGSQPAEAPPRDPLPRFTSDAVRTLFRDVARAIHPDLAADDPARDRRHTLMVEANRAYELGDAERLRAILEGWQRSPDAVQGRDLAAMRQRLERRITQLEDQLAACASELAALQDTSLWKLKAMVDAAAAGGKDLVADMVRRLQRDILVAQNRLDAIRWRG